MANEANTPGTQPPVLAYARLLRQVHALIAQGKGDTDEADALADLMDAPWYAMTPAEQARMRGLSADLYGLSEGGPKQVDMTQEQFTEWQRAARDAYASSGAGEVDAALNFLRRPVPSGLPRHVIPFLQARCWEKLGDLDTALVFMKEADRLDPNQALSVLALLKQLGREEEMPEYANRVIANRKAPPLELYFAAAALLLPTRKMSDSRAKPILDKVVPVLKRALAAYQSLPPTEKAEPPGADALIAQLLGLALERLGDEKSAIEVYSE